MRAAAIIVWLFFSLTINVYAQHHAVPFVVADTTTAGSKLPPAQAATNEQLDIIDVASNILHKGRGKRVDTGKKKADQFRVSVVPAAGYTLQTGFAGIVAGNTAFYIDTSASESTLLANFTYSVRNQIIAPIQASIYTKDNKYNIVIDWRYLYFPSYTYGLGGYTSLADGYLINYSAIRPHQTILRKVSKSMYVGLGFNLDYFYGIKELNPPGNKATDFETYGLSKTEFSSGPTFNYLYDTRTNPINPERGSFVNVIYRENPFFLGNATGWESLVVDLRKYFKFPLSSKNVFALWSYEWLTLSGKPPYLMLPNTGGDQNSNSGRGYIQGRFRGNNMAYLEGEYRFGITRNGLLGAVVFANAESFTEQLSNKFETIAPGCGLGIRLKFNKFSRTNVALDYGFGEGGSGGFFVNVGEVF
jgi:hypothetical protein